MRLSKRGEYGLRAMIMLAGSPQTDSQLPILLIKESQNRKKSR